MRTQRFRAIVAAGPSGRAVIAVPFDPDEVWGAKAEHPVGGTIDGRRVRGTISPGGSGWVFPLGPRWIRDECVAVGDEVIVELEPEGPQRQDLADDIAAALAANPVAAAFFDCSPVTSATVPDDGPDGSARRLETACHVRECPGPTV
jgi:Domain of unknown function (DUF1905)